MKIGVFLSGLLLCAGVATAQTGNQGPPSHGDDRAAQLQNSRRDGDRRDNDRGDRHNDHRDHDGRGDRDRRNGHWSGSRSSWHVGVEINIGGGHWGHPVPRCEPLPAPLPAPCPPPPPVCDTRSERIVVPGYWVDTPMLDHCGRQCFDRWGRPIMTRSYVPGYIEVITYQREVYRYWDGHCWRLGERWIEIGRERTAC